MRVSKVPARLIMLGLAFIVAGCKEAAAPHPPVAASSIVPASQTDVCQAIRETPPEAMKTFWLGLPYKGYKGDIESYDYDYKFSLPQAYFNQRGGAAMAERIGKSDGAILFSARYPDLAPYNLEIKNADFYSPRVKALRPDNWTNPQISILLGGRSQRPDTPVIRWLEPEYVRRLKSRFRRKPTSPEGWVLDEVPSPLAEGLLEIDPDMKYERYSIDRDHRFFIHRNEQDFITDAIICSLERFEEFRCKHTFEIENLGVRLRYHSQYLKDWRRIKENVIRLKRCMTVEKGPRPETL